MRRSLVLLATAGLATAAVAWQERVNQLQQDGRTISTTLRVVDGTLMVPVKDVASYLGGDLSVASGTATISGRAPAIGFDTTARAMASGAFPGIGVFSGAAQSFAQAHEQPKPRELSARVGESVENEGFRLTLVGVNEVAKGDYQTQYDLRRRKVAAPNRDQRLFVARMKVENASDRTQRAALPVSRDVTLFDDQGLGVPTTTFDARQIDPLPYNFDYGNDLAFAAPLESPLLAPKGAYEFAAVFSIPKDRTAKSVVVGLPPATSEGGGANVRFSL